MFIPPYGAGLYIMDTKKNNDREAVADGELKIAREEIGRVLEQLARCEHEAYDGSNALDYDKLLEQIQQIKQTVHRIATQYLHTSFESRFLAVKCSRRSVGRCHEDALHVTRTGEFLDRLSADQGLACVLARCPSGARSLILYKLLTALVYVRFTGLRCLALPILRAHSPMWAVERLLSSRRGLHEELIGSNSAVKTRAPALTAATQTHRRSNRGVGQQF